MIVPTKPERVLVKRGIGSDFEALMTHSVFVDKQDDFGKPMKGPFLGVGVRDDRGFELFARPEQIHAVEAETCSPQA